MKGFLELLQRRIWLGPLIALIVGLVLGLLFAWVVWPVSWTPGTSDVNAMATWYATGTDQSAAVNYTKQILAGISKDQQTALFTQAYQQKAQTQPLQARNISALGQAIGITVNPTPGATTPSAGVPTPAAPGTASSLVQQFGPIVLLLLLLFVIVAVAAWVLLAKVLPQMRAGQAVRSAAGEGGTPPPAPSARPVTTAPTTTPGGLGRFVASYTLGNDNYDTSFSLETTRQEFLGECGMGISETIGEGKPDKVTAFDLWLFDKADVRTVTQILMSEYAYNDQQLRAKLAAKGEAVLAEKGKVITLETQSLRLTAQVTDLVYANNPGTPPNSYFQKLVVDIVPALKEMVPA